MEMQKCPECERQVPANWAIPFANIMPERKVNCQTCLDRVIGPRGEPLLAGRGMKILTLHEPWASFMTRGYKKWETRSWGTPYRGPIAIHAAKTDEHLCDATFLLSNAGVMETAFVVPPFPMDDKDWPRGKILTVGELVDCVPTEKAEPSPQERALGDYTSGRVAWIFKDMRRVKPFPFGGMQGLKNLPSWAEAQLEYLTEEACEK